MECEVVEWMVELIHSDMEHPSNASYQFYTYSLQFLEAATQDMASSLRMNGQQAEPLAIDGLMAYHKY